MDDRNSRARRRHPTPGVGRERHLRARQYPALESRRPCAVADLGDTQYPQDPSFSGTVADELQLRQRADDLRSDFRNLYAERPSAIRRLRPRGRRSDARRIFRRTPVSAFRARRLPYTKVRIGFRAYRYHSCVVRVLIVEDERKLAQVVASALQAEHYDVVVAPTGEDGFFRANAEVFDLVVLDLMLPGRSGLEILHTLRQRHIDTPVLILTARDGVDDRVLGLDLGADDYLVKPFALPELLARIRALLRRGRPSDVLRLKAADLELDLVTRRATRGEALLDLTAREFELLEYLLRHQGHLVSREMLAREVWKEPRRATPLDNVIDVQMTRLRKKVDSETSERLIHTVRGVGFVLREGEP